MRPPMSQPLNKRLIGTETEYGIFVEGKDPSDLVEEVARLIRCYPGTFAAPWDYRFEDPRRDARGFRVPHLAVNPQDLRYEKPPSQRMPESEARSDRVLANGARLYNDHGHPEYSTPECTSIADLVAHDRAGERIILTCARIYEQQTGRKLYIYKNNTDYHGMSYGCHEDYLVRRDVPFQNIISGLLPFLVTRQIYTGAGKVGVEQDSKPPKRFFFQLSQRADFFTEVASVDTLHRRPIINTREEPHANPALYRRLHVIAGDANMMEFATALKVGTTSLVLSLIEAGWLPPFELRDPVDAVKKISRDQSLRWPVSTTAGESTALDIQRTYLQKAQDELSGQSPEVDWILSAWSDVLNALEANPMSLSDRIDWAAKRRLLEEFAQHENCFDDLSRLQGLDLEYHNIDPDRGLYHALEQANAVLRVVSDSDIENAVENPPSDTRAFVRGTFVSRFSSCVESITWSQIVFTVDGKSMVLDMNNMTDGNVADLNKALSASNDMAGFIEAVRKTYQDSA